MHKELNTHALAVLYVQDAALVQRRAGKTASGDKNATVTYDRNAGS